MQADYDDIIDRAAATAKAWLAGFEERPIPPTAMVGDVRRHLGERLPATGSDQDAVLERLTAAVEPGLMAIQSSRFYGWVMGGTFPVALGADWLVTAWDQNAGMRDATPGVVAAEELAGEYLLDLLGLPATADVGFVTGATTANMVGLIAGRTAVLRRAGWDVNRDGLAGGPRIRFIAGAERHTSVDLAARYAGLGLPLTVEADDQGRIRVDLLRSLLAEGEGPTIVCLQAGNLHSGAFDDFTGAIEAAHDAGAWVHIDGAFGLWAGAASGLRHLTAGYDGADSWATDAHKTLNVPYDCGIAVVADPVALNGAFSIHAAYLPRPAEGFDPYEKVPEMSRRARGVTVWATLAWLGRQGVDDLVQRLADSASALAQGLAQLPGVTILNDVVFTQVCLALEDDEAIAALAAALRADGTIFASPSRWRDRAVLRFSVSNWGTDETAVARTIEAVRSALASIRADVG
ncbi:aspartate aminotransferase family protein [Diaminobutyricibacter tongyongensis]|uniref:Aspartate aminotransferase family protein n=1 Tax=Leifsonia tongyongensis TaxID=1268043 RepID=A0A6L9Y1L6_9MICO|nr:pyridoxal-dependent decarboxylase [Diaminobutyricibacter tongyongensis]NEN07560.1 aspartate aminotransferase family protein [Diaminobutyricibacter tongyongensis]